MGDVASFGDDTLSVRFVGLTNSGCFDLIRLVPTFNQYVCITFAIQKHGKLSCNHLVVLIENLQPDGRIGKVPRVLLFALRRRFGAEHAACIQGSGCPAPHQGRALGWARPWLRHDRSQGRHHHGSWQSRRPRQCADIEPVGRGASP